MRAWKHWIQSATAKIIWNVKVKLYITYYRYYFSIEMKFLTSIWLRRCWLSVPFEYDEVAESPIKITVITIWASLHIIMNHELWGETFSQAYGKLCSWHTHTHKACLKNLVNGPISQWQHGPDAHKCTWLSRGTSRSATQRRVNVTVRVNPLQAIKWSQCER